jgi:MFS family permease
MREPKNWMKGLTPNVIKLGWVSCLADISSEMLYPIMPIFLTTVLGAPVSALGLIEGIAEAIASLLKTASGRWSDRLGKRIPFVFSGYFLSAAARPIIAAASGWGTVLFARSMDRTGKGLRSSPRDALLADSVPKEYFGKAFGFHRGMDTLGAVLGPIAALGFIALFHENLRWVFIVAFVPGVLGALLVLKVKEDEKTVAKAAAPRPNLSFRALPASFKRYLGIWTLFSLVNSSDMFLLLKAKQFGFTTTLTVLLYVFYNIVYAVASPVLGSLSDRIGRKPILTVGLLIFASVYAGFALATDRWQFWVLYGIYGLYIAATDGVGKALAVDLVSSEVRGAAIGLLGTMTGLAALVASTIAGLLWTHFGSGATFAYGAVGAVVSAFALIAFIPRVTSRN